MAAIAMGVGMGMDWMPGYPDITDHYDHSARIDGTTMEDASTEQLAAFLELCCGGLPGNGAESRGGWQADAPEAQDVLAVHALASSYARR